MFTIYVNRLAIHSQLPNEKPQLPPKRPVDKPPVDETRLQPPPEKLSLRETAVEASKKLTPAKIGEAREKMRTEVQGYVFTRYSDYLQNYEKLLEKRFPAAMKVYRVFMDGVKEFFADMKAFLKIRRIMSTRLDGLEVLTRKELELNYQMPRDMWKVAPVLVLSAVPFGHYVIFPLA